jgi:hypothetical protein
MAYVMVIVVVLLLVGIGARLGLAGSRARPGRDDDDVTDRNVVPPVNPDAPLPGSATRRREQGKP